MTLASNDGQLQPTYGAAGRAVFGFGLDSDTVQLRGYVKSPLDGGTWMFGDDEQDKAAIYIARVIPTGQPDNTFGPGNDGRRRIVLPQDLIPQTEALSLSGAIIQTDGKPLLYGGLYATGNQASTFPGLVCRVALNGTLDNSFGVNGCRTLSSGLSSNETCKVADIALVPEGGIAVVGNCSATDLPERPFLARLTADGAGDIEFGGGAVLVTPPLPAQAQAQRYIAVVATTDNSIAVAGEVVINTNTIQNRDIGLWKFDPGGSADLLFGQAGFRRIPFDKGGDNADYARDLALRPSGQLLVLGQTLLANPARQASLLAQTTANGIMDETFGPGGLRTEAANGALGPSSRVTSLDLDSQGRSLVAGTKVIGQPDAKPNTGMDLWLAFPASVPPAATVSVFISAETETSGTLESPSQGLSIPFVASPGAVTRIDLPEDVQNFTNEQISNKAVHVSASAPVAVQAFSGRPQATDSYAALPTSALGVDYRVMSWGEGLGRGSSIIVVAPELGVTNVFIVPSAPVGVHPAGVPFQVQLQQGQTYHLSMGGGSEDLTGTTVKSDKPIALLSGHSCAAVPNSATDYCDLAIEQMDPVNRWGHHFVTAPFAGRASGDMIRVLAHQSGTLVSVDGKVVSTLAAGQFLTLARTDPTYINASNPVSVAQFAKGCTSDMDDINGCDGDPMMVNIPPTTAWSKRYIAIVPDQPIQAIGDSPYTHYLTIVVPASAINNIAVDGVILPSANFSPIGASGYAFTQMQKLPGSYVVSAPEPISVAVYGHAPSESYGNPAAASVLPSEIVSGAVTSDDFVMRLTTKGERDPGFSADGMAFFDHSSISGAPGTNNDRAVRMIPDEDGILVGSASTSGDGSQSVFVGYRLIAADIFKDSFEN